jgi:hypothetical protein
LPTVVEQDPSALLADRMAMAAGDGGFSRRTSAEKARPEADDVALERDDGDVLAVLNGEVGAGLPGAGRGGARRADGVIEDRRPWWPGSGPPRTPARTRRGGVHGGMIEAAG